MGPSKRRSVAWARSAVRERMCRRMQRIAQRSKRHWLGSEHHGAVNGVIVSSIGALDRSLAAADEAHFRAVMASKVEVAVCVAEAFAAESLDFLLFFSSFNALSARPASGYSAGCVFQDACARYLSRERAHAVRVINWGYWGEVGVGATISGAHKARLVQSGVEPLDPHDAMRVMERVLAGPLVAQAYLHVDVCPRRACPATRSRWSRSRTRRC